MARKHYREGQRLFRKGRFREAIPALGKAVALWPRPEIYFNMALCHLELGERIEAATFLRRYLAGTNPAERRALPKPLRDLLAEMGVVVVRVSHREAEIWMNGRLRGRAFLEQVVLPGEVAVEVRMEGRPVVSKLLRVEPGQVVLWELDAGMLKVAGGRREPGGSRGDAGQGSASGEGGAAKLWRSRPRHHLAWFAGVGGLALVSAGAALILGVQTRAIHRDYLRDPSWPRRDLGLGYQTATNALWGLAGAAAVSAAVLALFTRFRSEGPDGPRRFGAEKVSLNLAVAPGGVEIFGTF